MRRDLGQLKLVALLIDGVHFAEHVVLAAIGVDVEGAKYPLGLCEGATENAAACKALLEDLIERGLKSQSRHPGGNRRGQGAAAGGTRHFGRARAGPALPGTRNATFSMHYPSACVPRSAPR